jgi:hypothetical protein
MATVMVLVLHAISFEALDYGYTSSRALKSLMQEKSCSSANTVQYEAKLYSILAHFGSSEYPNCSNMTFHRR